MANSSLNMKLDLETKNQLAEVLADYGLTIPQAFKLLANQIVKTKVVPLSFDYANTPINYEANLITMQAIDEAREGKLTRYADPDELMRALNESH